MMQHDTDIVSGLYFGRRQNSNKPIAYDEIRPCNLFRRIPTSKAITDIDTPYRPVRACGLGFCLIKVKAIKCMLKRYTRLFEPYKGLGEDFSFFYRARKCGIKCMLDTTINLGHIGQKIYGKEDYLKSLQNGG